MILNSGYLRGKQIGLSMWPSVRFNETFAAAQMMDRRNLKGKSSVPWCYRKTRSLKIHSGETQKWFMGK